MVFQSSLGVFNASEHTSPLDSENYTWRMMVRLLKCATRRIPSPQVTCSFTTTDTSNTGRLYRKVLVSNRKAPTHQLLSNEIGSSGSAVLQKITKKSQSPHTTPQWCFTTINRAEQDQWNSVH